MYFQLSQRSYQIKKSTVLAYYPYMAIHDKKKQDREWWDLSCCIKNSCFRSWNLKVISNSIKIRINPNAEQTVGEGLGGQEPPEERGDPWLPLQARRDRWGGQPSGAGLSFLLKIGMLQPSVCELLWSLFLPVVVKVVNSHFNLNSKLKFWLHIGDIPIQIVGSQSLWRGGGRKAAHHELSRDQGRDWWGIIRPTLSVRHVCSVGLSTLQSSSSTLKLSYIKQI